MNQKIIYIVVKEGIDTQLNISARKVIYLVAEEAINM
jgi:hypothetical protein